MNYYLTGFMGVGKTTLGKRAAKHLKMEFLDLDNWIEKEEKETIQNIFAKKGEQVFRELERYYLQQSIADYSNCLVATGGGTLASLLNLEFVKQRNRVIYLEADDKFLADRIKQNRAKRPLTKDLSDDEINELVVDRMRERGKTYRQAHIRLQVSGALDLTTYRLVEAILADKMNRLE